MIDAEIIGIEVYDIRFPTSMWNIGTDAMHDCPNHACTYVILITNTVYEGYGIAATMGKGNEFVVQTCKFIFEFLKNRRTTEIYSNFASLWRQITTDSELRWLGPECGVVHIATAAVVNALWDLWARIENKPVWKLLVDMTPEQLVSTMDFRYIRDVVTEEEAIHILKTNQLQKNQMEDMLQSKGCPAYTADVGWWTLNDQQMRSACKKFKKLEFQNFKCATGRTISDSSQRCQLIRSVVGKKMVLILDAHQIWDKDQVKSSIKGCQSAHPYCIENPTSNDDILGYIDVLEELKTLKNPVAVACGETCANRVLFKQLLKISRINFWNLNVGRLGGVNEALVVYFMAYKHNIPVWGYAGGIGLGEMVQHLQIWNSICLNQNTDDVIYTEYASFQHGYFKDPILIRKASYILPSRPGFSTELKNKCLERWSYPNGIRWVHLFKIKKYKNNLNYQKEREKKEKNKKE